MVQPVLKQDGIPDGALRYAGQLGAATSAHPALTAAADYSASSLARRFAPASARPRSAGADPTVLPRRDAAPARWSWRHRRAMFLASALAIATAAIAGGVALRGNSDSVGLDTALAGTGHDARRTPSTHASASLFRWTALRRSVRHGQRAGNAGPHGLLRVRSSAGLSYGPGIEIVSRTDGAWTEDDRRWLSRRRARLLSPRGGKRKRRSGRRGPEQPTIRISSRVSASRGSKPDRAEAAKWYARAAGLGIVNRDKALRAVTDRWGAGPAYRERLRHHHVDRHEAGGVPTAESRAPRRRSMPPRTRRSSNAWPAVKHPRRVPYGRNCSPRREEKSRRLGLFRGSSKPRQAFPPKRNGWKSRAP